MQYIPWGISILAILVSLYLASHKENKEDKEKDAEESKGLSVAFAKMDVKQDSILTNINEMRIEQKSQNNKISEIEKRMIVLDQSTKSAHHRIDDVARQIGLDKKGE